MQSKIITLNIGNMTCSGCSSSLESMLIKINGVKNASVNLILAVAEIEFDENIIKKEEIEKKIKELGFESLGEEKTKKTNEKLKIWTLSIGILFYMYYAMNHDLMHIIGKKLYSILMFAFSLPYIIYGFGIVKSGIKNLIKHKANMDTLIAIGVLANVGYSIYNLVQILLTNEMYDLYFEASAMIILFVKIGRYIDKNSKKEATESIKELVSLTPKTAIKLQDGKEIELRISEINKGDIIVSKPGETFSVDGIIVNGSASVDESMLTGESKPVKKEVNDKVIAGSINHNGYIEYRAEKIGRDTSISAIVNMVVSSVNSKNKMERIIDKISGKFVYIITIIAVLSGIVNYIITKNLSEAVNAFVSVMVVACPCTLGIAIPMAMVISVGRFYKNKILIKNSEVLEKLKKIDTIIFDKTGTLTTGKMKIVNQEMSARNFEILQNLEEFSHHPIAKSIVDAKKYKKLEIKNFKEVAGYGVQGKLEKIDFYAGNAKFVEKYHKENKFIKVEERYLKDGASIVYLFTKSEILGIIALNDKIKDTAKKIVEELKEMGKKLYLLTGDNEENASKIARKLKIENVISSAAPDKKLELVKKLNTNHNVMMIGDGINDAPSLKNASIGVSVFGGTNVSKDASDIVLLDKDLNLIIKIFKISSRTLKIIKQNLFFALFYNILMIPLATNLFVVRLSPMIASLAMVLSSITVITNSLRLMKENK